MDHGGMSRAKIKPVWLVASGLAVLALVSAGVPLGSLLFVGILLLCPLLMAGMHGGHGHGGGHDAHAEEPDRVGSSDPGRSGTQAGSPPVEGGRP